MILRFLGKRKRSTGPILRDNRSIRPDFCPISMIPVQKDITPNIVIHSMTASFADESAPSVTALKFPWNAAHKTPTTIINAQR